jgi:hypothetical protein
LKLWSSDFALVAGHSLLGPGDFVAGHSLLGHGGFKRNSEKERN